MKVSSLKSLLIERLSPDWVSEIEMACNEVTLEVPPTALLAVCQLLKDDPDFRFEMLMDVCGVDYLHYGSAEWETHAATDRGFERAVFSLGTGEAENRRWKKPRFAVVYHLLSLTHNHRLRIKTFLSDPMPCVDSVISVWPSADWYEREAFDLFGILFKGHPDLRRLLTDYGFIGHPFRKDFPLSGEVEVRYDAKQGRVVYEAVDIVPRVLVPKVIRHSQENESEEPHA